MGSSRINAGFITFADKKNNYRTIYDFLLSLLIVDGEFG